LRRFAFDRLDSLAMNPSPRQLELIEEVRRSQSVTVEALAERLGHGRLLATGGGGYHRGNLAEAWTGVVESLIE